MGLHAGPMGRAAEALRRRQHANGHWEDFVLPVGRTDGWVTAYVGLALAAHATLTGDEASAQASARGAAWLVDARGGEPGWGYNRRTGVDTDSTAHALLLLRHHGLACAAAAAWLRAGWLPGGGFATYRRADAWGVAHPCVTPVAYLALDDTGRRELRDGFAAYALACRDGDGPWRAYWWETRCYSTLVNLLALRSAGVLVDDGATAITALMTTPIEHAFDLACLVGVAALTGTATATDELVARLLASAGSDGSWPASAGLRVTEPDCYQPWLRPAGRIYRDVDGVFTTATALRALVLVGEVAR